MGKKQVKENLDYCLWKLWIPSVIPLPNASSVIQCIVNMVFERNVEPICKVNVILDISLTQTKPTALTQQIVWLPNRYFKLRFILKKTRCNIYCSYIPNCLLNLLIYSRQRQTDRGRYISFVADAYGMLQTGRYGLYEWSWVPEKKHSGFLTDREKFVERRRGHYTEYNSEHCLFSDTVHLIVDTELFCWHLFSKCMVKYFNLCVMYQNACA